MTQVQVNQGGFVIDAALLSDAFDLSPDDVQSLMRSGEIMSRCETGVDEDAGQSRLTFHYRDRAVRLVVDQAGTILKRVSFPARSRNSFSCEVFSSPAEDQVPT